MSRFRMKIGRLSDDEFMSSDSDSVALASCPEARATRPLHPEETQTLALRSARVSLYVNAAHALRPGNAARSPGPRALDAVNR